METTALPKLGVADEATYRCALSLSERLDSTTHNLLKSLQKRHANISSSSKSPYPSPLRLYFTNNSPSPASIKAKENFDFLNLSFSKTYEDKVRIFLHKIAKKSIKYYEIHKCMIDWINNITSKSDHEIPRDIRFICLFSLSFSLFLFFISFFCFQNLHLYMSSSCTFYLFLSVMMILKLF